MVLQFDAVRFRAEIFINKQLAGYDLVNSTPFEIDITDFVKYGVINDIAIRITDPNGNFDWRDSQNFMWGNYRTNPTHGFGGITGKVKLVTTDKSYISTLFIRNTPVPNKIDVHLVLTNLTGKYESGSLFLEIIEAKPNGKSVFSNSYIVEAPDDKAPVELKNIIVDKAKLWSVDSPCTKRRTSRTW